MVIRTETKTVIMTSTFYPPFHIGGDAVHVKYLAEELTRRGHEVHVLHSIDAYRLKSGGTLPREEATGVHLHPVESGAGRVSPVLTFLTGSNRRAERMLERLMKEESPDWIHHHNISLLGARILTVGNVPKLYTAHDYWLACQRSDLLCPGHGECEDQRCFRCSVRSVRPYQMWRSSTLRKGISMIDLFIAPSAFMASVLRQRLGIEAVVIPNFAPRPSIEGSGRVSERYFLFASVLEKHKGLDLLLDAYRNGDAISGLHIAGRGNLEGLVREREREMGGKIRYLGFLDRDELLSEIRSALAVVLPSQCPENSPLSCIEALALGTPIIVSGRGGLPELVDDPQSGLICGPSAGEISEVLRRMEGDSELRDRLSKNALLRYERNHTPEHYVDAYMNRVERIVLAS
ncbi:MAG: glycosyltransferase [Methanomassiliicoccales archaeon]|nr:glycosyltransferase [Methanomassiliicoccales archaeon]